MKDPYLIIVLCYKDNTKIMKQFISGMVKVWYIKYVGKILC